MHRPASVQYIQGTKERSIVSDHPVVRPQEAHQESFRVQDKEGPSVVNVSELPFVPTESDVQLTKWTPSDQVQHHREGQQVFGNRTFKDDQQAERKPNPISRPQSIVTSNTRHSNARDDGNFEGIRSPFMYYAIAAERSRRFPPDNCLPQDAALVDAEADYDNSDHGSMEYKNDGEPRRPSEAPHAPAHPSKLHQSSAALPLTSSAADMDSDETDLIFKVDGIEEDINMDSMGDREAYEVMGTYGTNANEDKQAFQGPRSGSVNASDCTKQGSLSGPVRATPNYLFSTSC